MRRTRSAPLRLRHRPRRALYSLSAAAGAPLAPRPATWQPGTMAREATEPWVQLATRIPKDLHRRLKLYCVTKDIALMHFVTEAIEEKLGRKPGPKKRK